MHCEKEECSGGSCACSYLTEVEEDFLCLVREGSLPQVKNFLKKHSKNGEYDFNVNCVNYKNEGAMSMAIEKHNQEMVYYLSGVVNMTKNDMLLMAVHSGDIDMVICLCESLDADSESLRGEFVPQKGVPDYPISITPLILASIEGYVEIIGYLIDRGHAIFEPHKPGCLCEDVCMKILKFSDPLELAQSSLYVYAALSNPAYFIFTTSDPIYYAFKLHQRIVSMAKIETAFSRQYEGAANRLAHFTAMLIAECRTNEEVHLVLRQTNRPKTRWKNISLGDYPRLEMALEFDQKEFVIQPNVQIFLQNKFYGMFEDWMYYSNMSKICYPLLRVFTLPSAFFNFLIYPSSKSAKFYAAPINRMLHYLATYIIFLIVLIIENRREKPAEHECGLLSIWTVLICLYFLGLTAMLVSQSMLAGFASFHWNKYDIVMVALYGSFVALNISSQIHIRVKGTTLRERAYWSELDPQLLAEGILVLATIMAFLKLFMFTQVHKVLGPLQVSICRMMKEFFCYSWYAVALLIAYVIAFSKFYSYYSGMSYIDPMTNERSAQSESFIGFTSTFKTFFWSIFGMSEVEDADVVIDNFNNHLFTQLIGYIGLGTFALFMLLIVKNMIAAVMIQVHQNMYGDHLRKVWLFRRTQVFMYFMNFPVLPPPFNLLPSMYNRRYLRDKQDLEEACEQQGLDYDCQYFNLMKLLVIRYFNRLGKTKACEETFPPTTHIGDGEKRNTEKQRCRSL